MIVAIDIGNSNVVVGVAKGEDWRHIWRLPTVSDREAALFYSKQLGQLLMDVDVAPGMVQTVIISSVVPDVTQVWEEIVSGLLGCTAIVMGPKVYPYLPLQIDRPDEIGTDLVANALAGHTRIKDDVIVVDFGTALTFTIVDKSGHILGVNIAPGLKTAITALFSKTAQLPEVPLELPSSIVGEGTVHAIQNGVLVGYVGLVRHMLSEIRKELGPQYKAIATGGLSAILHPLQDDFSYIDSALTLNGIRLVGEILSKNA